MQYRTFGDFLWPTSGVYYLYEELCEALESELKIYLLLLRNLAKYYIYPRRLLIRRFNINSTSAKSSSTASTDPLSAIPDCFHSRSSCLTFSTMASADPILCNAANSERPPGWDSMLLVDRSWLVSFCATDMVSGDYGCVFEAS